MNSVIVTICSLAVVDRSDSSSQYELNICHCVLLLTQNKTFFNTKLGQSVMYLNQLTNTQCCRSPVYLNCHTELACNLAESEKNWKTLMLSTDSKLKSKCVHTLRRYENKDILHQGFTMSVMSPGMELMMSWGSSRGKGSVQGSFPLLDVFFWAGHKDLL